MPIFKFNKLVRDKIPENIIASGNKPEVRVLVPDELLRELLLKLQEESTEISKASKDELASEIADLYEILSATIKVLDLSNDDIQKIREEKNKKAGAFEHGLYIGKVTTKVDSKWNDYYRATPEKYPELDE